MPSERCDGLSAEKGATQQLFNKLGRSPGQNQQQSSLLAPTPGQMGEGLVGGQNNQPQPAQQLDEPVDPQVCLAQDAQSNNLARLGYAMGGGGNHSHLENWLWDYQQYDPAHGNAPTLMAEWFQAAYKDGTCCFCNGPHGFSRCRMVPQMKSWAGEGVHVQLVFDTFDLQRKITNLGTVGGATARWARIARTKNRKK